MNRRFLYVDEAAYVLQEDHHIAVHRLVAAGLLAARRVPGDKLLHISVAGLADLVPLHRQGILEAVAERRVVIARSQCSDVMRAWIRDSLWPSAGAAFDVDLRAHHDAWAEARHLPPAPRNVFTRALERSGHPRRPNSAKPKAHWRMWLGVRLRGDGEPLATARSVLAPFEIRAVGRDTDLTGAVLAGEVAVVPSFGLAAATHHGVDIFVAEGCNVELRATSTTTILHHAYTDWCAGHDLPAIPRRYFGELLHNLGFVRPCHAPWARGIVDDSDGRVGLRLR